MGGQRKNSFPERVFTCQSPAWPITQVNLKYECVTILILMMIMVIYDCDDDGGDDDYDNCDDDDEEEDKDDVT